LLQGIGVVTRALVTTPSLFCFLPPFCSLSNSEMSFPHRH
jgi:hypothetical protein